MIKSKPTQITSRLHRFLPGVVSLVLASMSPAQAGLLTSIAPYTVPVGSDYTIVPLLSTGDRLPRTSNPSQQYQMIGIPDGLGAHANADGTMTLYMNHELRNNNNSEPIIGQPLNRGAIISRLILAADGSLLSGDRAYSTIYTENVLVGPPPAVGNSTPAFSRFCSGSLAWEEAGFDRPIYFAGEENPAPATFDPRGGSLTATFDNALWTLPKCGHLSWENAVPRPDPGIRTVIMCLEDGAIGDCQLYMYVGHKDHSPGAGPLRRNGLDNGALYVFVSNNRKRNSEVNFRAGSVTGRWVLLSGAEGMTDVQLEAASDAVGAFAFDRIEDGAFRPGHPNEFYFDTTGGSEANRLGRLYRLDLNADNIFGPAKLTVIYNADEIIAAGGDIAISPDNIDVSEDYIMICEDGTAPSSIVMAEKGRKGNMWRLDLNNNYAAENIAELTAIGRDGVEVNSGNWETSGIISTSGFFGVDSWLFDVQAHPPTAAPAPNTVEDGQLLLMIRNR
jgi:hypothetical protein